MRLPAAGFASLVVFALGCASVSRSVSSPTAPAIAPLSTGAPATETADGWFASGARAAAERGGGRSRARNVILFVGDGMSLTTVAAARIFEGQRQGRPGEEHALSWEQFPATALSRTYNTDSQTPDSAGTMTAMITGSKTRLGLISVGPGVARGDCAAARGAPLASALEIAEATGLATGVVTTTRITHATPAAAYSHVPDRDWEADSDLPPAAIEAGCADIARQLIEFPYGDGIEVALGGGRSRFMAAGDEDPEYPDLIGTRLDGRDLVGEWRQRHPEGRYVWNARQLAELDLAHTPRLFGLFEPEHMQFEHDRGSDRGGEPSLAEMTRAAISVLRQDPDGFFLVVEGGRIDHAHHNGNAYRALADTIALSDAVRTASEMTSADDTLILVTADHSHTLVFAGYPQRGNPILGKVVGGSGEGRSEGYARDATGLSYTTLSYANGPGYAGATDQQPEGPKTYPHLVSGAQSATLGRPNLEDVDTAAPDYLQESLLPLGYETHGGDDVGVWARGPGSEAVRGNVEQHVVFHWLVQAQPQLRERLCALVPCEGGVPTAAPRRVGP
jgi:alkaline phosphatase